VLLSIIEGRLANDRPAEVLGIDRDAPIGEACEVYTQLLGELARFRDHPHYEERALAATRRLRVVLYAFSCRMRELPYSGITRRR
jgi:hypothetical protein